MYFRNSFFPGGISSSSLPKLRKQKQHNMICRDPTYLPPEPRATRFHRLKEYHQVLSGEDCLIMLPILYSGLGSRKEGNLSQL